METYIMKIILEKFNEIARDKRISKADLLENGAIYYMNGNDGTDFDWEANNRTCEFMAFYKSSELGMAKLYVNTDGKIDGYFWNNEGRGEAEYIEAGNVEKEKAEEFKEFLEDNFDYKNKWDNIIDYI